MVRWEAGDEEGDGAGGATGHDRRAVRLPLHGLLQLQQDFRVDRRRRHAPVRNEQAELNARLGVLFRFFSFFLSMYICIKEFRKIDK